MQAILAAALTVHRALGPGLRERSYQTCLKAELRRRWLTVRTQVPILAEGFDVAPDGECRADFVVAESVIVEIKAVSALRPVHEAQLLGYLRHLGLSAGLLINFNVVRLVDGVRRFLL